MINMDYPNISIEDKTNEQNIDYIRTYIGNLLDNLNYQIDNLQAQIDALKGSEEEE